MVNKEPYLLFLDDIRSPTSAWMNHERRLQYDNHKWTVVRSYKEFCQTIDEKGIPVFVSYDHDLGDEHYDISMYDGVDEYEKLAKSFKEPTGLECAKYLISKLEPGLPHPEHIVHSQNPAGRIRIENSIRDYNKSLDL